MAVEKLNNVVFRILFIFFIILALPNRLTWYQNLIHIDCTNLHYRDLYDIARFESGVTLFGNQLFGSSFFGYATWLITFMIAIVLGLIWTFIDSKNSAEPREYRKLSYWLRVIVRYRAGIGIIGFGFTKLLPVQMPYPSLGLLNTDFGDFTAQKIYWLSIGIVPWYQVFAGVVEIFGGILLFFRKTTLWGAVILFAALGDIVYVNIAYDGGVHGYSSYFVLLCGFLIYPYLRPLYDLLIKNQPAKLNFYYPDLSKKWIKYTRAGLKSAVFLVFLFLLFYLQYINFRYDPYKQPSSAGIKELRGNYTVTEFRLNNKILPYHPSDTIRWQEVTFEKWTTLTYKVNKPVAIDLSNGGGSPQRDINRSFEITGTAGGRKAFHYYADTIENVLYLQDKYRKAPARRNEAAGNFKKSAAKYQCEINLKGKAKKEWISDQAWKNIGNELYFIDHHASSARRNHAFVKEPVGENRQKMILNYSTNNGSRVILSGINAHKDSIYVILDKVDRKYALSESTLEAGKY